ncbi:MAG: aldo/keto reductase, partial [Acidimicrobiales bacterium]
TRRLGRTEHHTSVAILGGAAFARCKPEEAEAGWDAALDAGINHLDIAPTYGQAQALIGPLLPAQRHRLFVACKTARHNPGGVLAQLEESLTTLGCEQFDLYQLHGVTDMAELDRRNAAIEVILAERQTIMAEVAGEELIFPMATA